MSSAVAVPFTRIEDASFSPQEYSTRSILHQSFPSIQGPSTPPGQLSCYLPPPKSILPPAPPPLQRQEGSDAEILPLPTRANRPTLVVPPAAPLATIHSGSIIGNFRAALEGIDIDECEAHGENAFFVCDLAEVWRQHQRWQRELGDRVDAFFGKFNASSTASRNFRGD